MSSLKRCLLLGSIVMLLLTGCLGTFSAKAPTAHAACSQGCADNPCPPSQSENNSGNNTSWVEVIQFALNSKEEIFRNVGYTFPHWPLTIDGDFGPNTETAVANWQAFDGITGGGGVVGDRTWESLTMCPGDFSRGPANISVGTTCPPSQSENSSSNNPVFVQAIQDMLNELHRSDSLSASFPASWSPFLASDGSFGSQTHNAVIDWQSQMSISNGGGVVGTRTWQSFNMCW